MAEKWVKPIYEYLHHYVNGSIVSLEMYNHAPRIELGVPETPQYSGCILGSPESVTDTLAILADE